MGCLPPWGRRFARVGSTSAGSVEAAVSRQIDGDLCIDASGPGTCGRPAAFSAAAAALLVQLGGVRAPHPAPEPWRVVAGYLFFLPWLLLVFALLSRRSCSRRSGRSGWTWPRVVIMRWSTRRSRARGAERTAAGRSIEQDRFPGVRARIHRRSLAGLQSSDPGPFARANRIVCISPRCGSNVVTALGAGVVLLLALVGWSVAFRPSWTMRVAAAGGNRRAVRGRSAVPSAMRIQRRFFMAVDFADVSLRDLRHVPPEVFDRGPVVSVETIVRPQSNASTR